MGEANYIQGIFLDSIFFNEDNGFSIGTVLVTEYQCNEEQLKLAYKSVDEKVIDTLGLNDKEEHHKITVSGYFPKLVSHKTYRFNGSLTQHPKYGWQFQATSYDSVTVRGKSSLVHYLSSDIFEGIGQKTAEKIVETLGENAIDVILRNRQALDEVPKLSKKLADKLYATLVDQQGTEQILAPLYGYDLSPRLVMKIFKKYQYQALEIIQENPYRLIDDIEGIGFIKADELAKRLGVASDDPRRIRAALLYVIDQIAIQKGHTYVYHKQLLQSALQYLNQKSNQLLDLAQIEGQIQALIQKKKIYIEGDFLFIPLLVNSEKGIAESIMRLQTEVQAEDEQVLNTISELKDEMAITYSPEQEEAIKMALKQPVSIITGGPGTGKTTVVQGILKAYGLLHHLSLDPTKYATSEKPFPIALAAPTGRAAKRMTETTGLKASTIHRLLGYGVDGVFQHDEFSQLDYDLIIIDESSMLDTLLAFQLFQSIKTGAQVILVGDDNQLPSVGPGQVLKDLIESGAIPLTRLLTVHRQAQDSSIISLAHAVKNNHLPDDLRVKKPDRLYVEATHQQIPVYLKQIVENAISKGYTANEVQILVPMYRGDCGIDSLNVMLQEIFNPPDEQNKREMTFGQCIFRIGDKVLQLANQPETGVMNGDVGEVIGISYKNENDDKEEKLIACFDTKEVTYKKGDLQNLTHAYCVSVHKSQGSEYPIVILPMTHAYHVMLQKKLIYTAITRAKRSLIVIGEYLAFDKGVKNEGEERQTTLRLRFDLQKEQVPKENPFADYFKEHHIPFDYLDEEQLEGITPYDFMEE
ncbi:SF1B family DNA helicase RecD2 [Turicibacter sp. H121]|uniref:SF1B family DNA helicase RecD2 n=1 Tax=Turicibacter sp. H121 TaxID=1712675 RepID=UPI00076301CE|nr:ATP-dependent RecD-like DNA helicase [Turicibacter sp. H121]AMC07572.1 helicase RecD [Turicibacter sp. H121]MCU7200379.1 ATP-dependent RecD-like DNA helicase [Turicibacter sp. H121]